MLVLFLLQGFQRAVGALQADALQHLAHVLVEAVEVFLAQLGGTVLGLVAVVKDAEHGRAAAGHRDTPQAALFETPESFRDSGIETERRRLKVVRPQIALRFLELRNGIVAAEKIRILREKGLFAEEIAELEKKFDRKKAMANKCDFFTIRSRTQKVVNLP